MAAYKKDFEDIKEEYGPPVFSIILHLLFLLAIGAFSDAVMDERDIPRYIDIQMGSPYRANRAIVPAQESPFIAEKMQQQQELQEKVAEKIEKAQKLAEKGIMPKIPLLPEEKKLLQEQKKRQERQKQQPPSQQSQAQKQEEGKGEKRGNSNKGQDSATYLEWLQLTVQETSQIPIQARQQGISGSAVLRMSFDRDGYVHDFRLVKPTGSRILDAAALRVARRLTFEPFPPMPTDFEQGKSIVTYDFPISFTP